MRRRFAVITTWLSLTGAALLYQNFTRPADGIYRILVTQKASAIKAQYRTDTLTKALAHIQATVPKGSVDSIEIMINGGSYAGESVTINDANLKAPLKIRAVDLQNKPVFNGHSEAGREYLFLRASLKNNQFPITIQGLKVRNYNEAISIASAGGSVYQGVVMGKGHRIEDCDFSDLGSEYGQTDKKSYGAVKLQNMTNSIIRRNTFTNIISKEDSFILHAIYIAHHSSNNIISGNTFSKVSGDYIRFRNRSHRNLVEYNHFYPTPFGNVAAVSTWFDAKDDAIENLECPSYGIRVQYNSTRSLSLASERTAVSKARSKCPDPSGSDEVFLLARNLDLSNGQCEVQSFQTCSSFGLKSNMPILDYLSTTAHASSSVCKGRAGAYYNSCTKRTNDTTQVYQTRHLSSGSQSISYYGKGCLIDMQNCSRMKKKDFFVYVDNDVTAQTNASRCQARAAAWYGSCAKDDSKGERFARSLFINEDNKPVEKIVGHGCLIKASFCPRMNFKANQIKVDTREEAHVSASACMSRASAYMASCSKDGNSVDRTVTAYYYQYGKLIQSKSVKED